MKPFVLHNGPVALCASGATVKGCQWTEGAPLRHPAVWQLANTQRSPAFWKAHTTFKQQIEEEARRAHHIQHTLLSISRAVLYQHHADQAAGTEAEMEPEISQSAAACPAPWPGIPEVAGCPRDLIDWAAGCHLNL